MQFGILGPLEVSDEGRRVEIGGHEAARPPCLAPAARERGRLARPVDRRALGRDAPADCGEDASGSRLAAAPVAQRRRGPAAHSAGRSRPAGTATSCTVEPGRARRGSLPAACSRRRGALEPRANPERGGRGAAACSRPLARAPPWPTSPTSRSHRPRSRASTSCSSTALEERIEADLALGRHARAGRRARGARRAGIRCASGCAASSCSRSTAPTARPRRCTSTRRVGWRSPRSSGWSRARACSGSSARSSSRTRRSPPPAREAAGRGRLRAARDCSSWPALAAALTPSPQSPSLLRPRRRPRDGRRRRRGRSRAATRGVLDPRTGELLGDRPARDGAREHRRRGRKRLGARRRRPDRLADRSDASARVVRTFSTGSTPTDIAVGAGAIWVGNGVRERRRPRSRRASPDSTRSRPSSTRRSPCPGRSGTATIRVGRHSLRPHIAATRDAVWVVNPDLSVSRIDPRTNRRRGEGRRRPGAVSIAAGDGRRVGRQRRRRARRDRSADERASSKPIEVAAESLTALARRRRRGLGRRSRSAAASGGSTPTRSRILRSIPLEVGVGGGRLRRGGGVGDQRGRRRGLPHRPATRTRRASSAGSRHARGIAVGEGAVWVTAPAPPSADEALPASACSKLVYGGSGQPALRSSPPTSRCRARPARPPLPMAEAIRVVLRERWVSRPARYTYRLPVVRRLDGAGWAELRERDVPPRMRGPTSRATA